MTTTSEDDDFGSNIPKKVKSKGRIEPQVADEGVDETEAEDDDYEAPQPVVVKRRVAKPAQGMPQKIKIILEENEVIPPTGLYLSHNGRPYVIQTGVEVEIPVFLKEILDNAVISIPVTEPSTQQVIGYRNRLRYPYRVI